MGRLEARNKGYLTPTDLLEIQSMAQTAAGPYVPTVMSPIAQKAHVFPTELCRKDSYKLSRNLQLDVCQGLY